MREAGKTEVVPRFNALCLLTGGVFLNKPIDVLSMHPIRKSKKQKQKFREDVLAYIRALGYQASVEKGSFGVHNVIIGDPEHAKYLITAHYDTCAAMPVPNFITPCNFGIYLVWQLLLTLLLCVPVGLLGGVLNVVLDQPDLSFLIAYFLLLVELFLMMAGPANRNNANDNTSGVVSVLETAASMPMELRSDVCFVLFDLEEAGLLGSTAFRNKHKRTSSSQLILNLDCVGEGDEILLIPTKKLKKDTLRLRGIQQLCPLRNQKLLKVQDKGFCFYPSDQANFPLGIGIAAFCRSKKLGLYLAKIHTSRDRILDENNVALLRDYLIDLVRSKA